MLTNVMSRETVLKRFILTLNEMYDYIIIDINQTLGLLPNNALTASANVIIPVQAEPFVVDGMGALLHRVANVKKLFDPDLRIGGVVIIMADERTNFCKQIDNQIKEQYGNNLHIVLLAFNGLKNIIIGLLEGKYHKQVILFSSIGNRMEFLNMLPLYNVLRMERSILLREIQITNVEMLVTL